MNRNQLKYLSACAMFIDHLAWAFVPTGSATGQAMHFIGRLADPVMAYFVAEGYLHTRDVDRYTLRLFLFALISQIPFSLFQHGILFSPEPNVMFTLFLGLLAIRLWDRSRRSPAFRLIAVSALCILSIPGDWSFLNVLWPLCFFVFREDEHRKWQSYSIIAALWIVWRIAQQGTDALFHLGLLCAPLLLGRYNGERGSSALFHKWFFYLFYPGHLLVLWLLKR